MHQRQRLHQVFIQPQFGGNCARDLRDFNRVRQPVAEMVGVPACENLRLVLQPAKRARVYHAVAVALEVIAVRMGRLRITPSAALLGAQRIRSKHEMSVS